MKHLILSLVNKIALPFMGKGIDKHFPFLITLYEYFYTRLQSKEWEVVPIPMGGRLNIDKSDAYLGMSLLYKGSYEPVQTKEFIDALSTQSIVLDVGANFGYYSVIASKKCSQGAVHAFEPDKSNYAVLVSNVLENSASNFFAINAAISDEVGELAFSSNPVHRGKSGVALVGEQSDYTVPCMTIDDYCARNNIEVVDVIKIDVEGFEPKVLLGAKTTIMNSPKVRVFVEFNPDSLKSVGLDTQAFFGAAESCGLKAVSIIDESSHSVYPFTQETLQRVLAHNAFTNLILGKYEN